MGETLASFRDLKGIGPATEARLHEKGIYTWEALAAAATALAAVGGDSGTLRDVANVVAARRAAAGRADPLDGERLEAFVLRIALSADGEPRRFEVTHVRTMAEQARAGWAPDRLVEFVHEQAGIRLEPEDSDPGPPASRASANHVVVLDAGKKVGGSSRDINLVLTNTCAARGDFGYRATLAARRLGAGGGWTTVAGDAGTGSPARELALTFPEVALPTGIQCLRLSLQLNLDTPARTPPGFVLVG